MQCERARELLSAYIDNELDAGERRAVAAHVAECRACAAAVNDMRRIGGLLAQAGRERPAKALAPRIERVLAGAAETAPRTTPPRVRLAPHVAVSRSFVRQVAAMAAISALTAILTWWSVSSTSEFAQLEHDILAAHVRSLLQESPVQVATSDTHTVKPWFTGRIDYAPEVKDLAVEGFPLVGGRLDYVGGHRVGALVYKRRLHSINVFMWPADGEADAAPHLTTREGYNLLTWRRKGLTFWAISDLNAGELRELQSLL